jgi:hypothetical protein
MVLYKAGLPKSVDEAVMPDDVSHRVESASASTVVPRPGRPTRIGWAEVVELLRLENLPLR